MTRVPDIMPYSTYPPEGNAASSRLIAWLGTAGVLILTGWLAANDGGYFAQELYTGAVCAWTLTGLVVLLDWDHLRLAGASLLPLLFCAAVLFWTGASTFWSISPDSSLKEFSRVAVYLACFFLVLSGPAIRRHIVLSIAAFTALGTGLGAFALLAKISPEYSQDFTIAGGRIMGSLGYWNALALFMVMSILPCLWLSSSPEIPRTGRMVATSALFVMGVTLFFTLSRGGLVIGTISVLLWLAVSRDRLASLLSLLAAVLPAGLLIWRTFSALPSLHSSVEATRIDPAEGRQFAIMLLAGIVSAGVLKAFSLWLPPRVPANRKWLTYTMVFWAAVIAIIAAAGLSQYTRVFDKLNELETREETSSTAEKSQIVESKGISRLVSIDSERLELWRIGIDNFKSHPMKGTGAGTYQFVNMKQQSGAGQARDPHSIWVRFLSDQGIIGFMLLIGLIGSIGYGLVMPLFSSASLRRDGLYLSLLFALAAWLADSSIEWNWKLPAVAIPFFIMAGLAFRLAATDEAAGIIGNIKSWPVPVWMRMAGMTLAVLTSMVSLALIGSVILEERAADFLADGELEAASMNASRAGRLNPADAKPLVMESKIAEARGDYAEAWELMMDAIDIEPEESSYYERLALLEFYKLNETKEGIASLSRALDLAPQERGLHLLLHRLHADEEVLLAGSGMAAAPVESAE